MKPMSASPPPPDNPDQSLARPLAIPDNGQAWRGLTDDEVLQQRAQYGENRLPAQKAVSVSSILLSQFKSPLVYIILVAAAVSLILQEFGDFSIIIVVVIIDVLLGFFQEYRAQQTYLALRNLLKPTATVIRNQQRQEIEVWELVPGDLVLLATGEKAPGDGMLLEATLLACDESILTGESEPVSKRAVAPAPAPSPSPAAGPAREADVADSSRIFMGSTVVTGRGLMQVTKTGLRTELGQIAASLKDQREEATPFQIRLKSFSKILTYIVAGFTGIILLVGLLMQRPFLDMLRTAIILAIAAVPEGLLIAVTVILVLGMRKILHRNGLVKKLLAVETLGSVTVICTDKTGTLTEGRMRVSRLDLADEEQAWRTMVLCNNLEGPVDIALWEKASQMRPGESESLQNACRRSDEELFTSEKKYMITEVADTSSRQGHRFYLKGAPEVVLAMCQARPGGEAGPGIQDTGRPDHARIQTQIDAWADQGLRLIALAWREGGTLDDHQGYQWAGLAGLEDPIREGVQASITVARRAGIQVKMITGDYRRTAERIAGSLGLLQTDNQTLDGSAISQMSDQELQEVVRQTAVFARIRPQDKLRIVRALQANGEITAMIGDGVNDAPALQCANIGVVVGSATDVAKETADLILLDSNFRTIVAAVEEGRIIFANIRKVVAYTLSNSFAEVLTIFWAMILRWPVPLTIAQILWIHLICDGPSDIVLGFEPREDGIMEEKPRPLKDPILTPLALSLIIIISVASAIFVLLLFGHYFQAHNDPAEGRSLAYASFAINSMIYIFAYRSMRVPIWRMNPLTANKPLIAAVMTGLLTALGAFLIPAIRNLLGLAWLTWMEWIWVTGFAVSLLIIVELGKAIAGRYYTRS